MIAEALRASGAVVPSGSYRSDVPVVPDQVTVHLDLWESPADFGDRSPAIQARTATFRLVPQSREWDLGVYACNHVMAEVHKKLEDSFYRNRHRYGYAIRFASDGQVRPTKPIGDSALLNARLRHGSGVEPFCLKANYEYLTAYMRFFNASLPAPLKDACMRLAAEKRRKVTLFGNPLEPWYFLQWLEPAAFDPNILLKEFKLWLNSSD